MADHKIRNPEHYFNRYIACEIMNDRRKAAEIRAAECSLDEKLESDKHPRELISNLHGELFSGIGNFLDEIEDERLHAALCSLSAEQLRLIKMACVDCLTQCEIAEIMGISQKNICKKLHVAYEKIKKEY